MSSSSFVPRRSIYFLAYAVPLTLVPSAMWRASAALGVYGEGHVVTEAARSGLTGIVLVSTVPLLLCLLALGLVYPWGALFQSGCLG